ncbi:hypothetical protein HPULCUR_002680 [Helicostylum pulchrum]|uniref:Uncharacterized protein n=1 Tax=Helicostylum pulchrum TaxID=562976 RepID=A0ABP9XR72_9FUNG
MGKPSTPATPDSPSVSTTAVIDPDEAMRKKQERVRLWKEKKLAEEEAKKKLAIAAAEKEAQELKLKQQQLELKKQQEEEEAKKLEQEQEPQLLQQFAAMRKAAAEAAAKEEAAAADDENNKEGMDISEDNTTQHLETEEEEGNGKKWSLEDDSESEDDASMDIDGDELKKQEAKAEADKAAAEAERTFKPLQRSNNDDESKEDSILAKPKKSFLMSNLSTKPKNTMRMGFGLGKPMMMKKPTPPTVKKDVQPAQPTPVEKEPVDTVMEDSDEIDPLEAYMIDVHAETKKINEEDRIRMGKLKEPSANRRGSLMDDDDNLPDDSNIAENEEDIGSDPEDILA